MPRLKKLDRYVIGTFFWPFFLCLVGFTGLYVVIDFFSNIDEFLGHSSVFEVIRQTVVYYVLRVPSYLAQVMPVLTVVPAVICLVRLERSNELCAMRACGLSLRRIAAPLFGCGLVVMVLAFVNQEVLVPGLHDRLSEAERRARRRGSARRGLSHVVTRDGQFVLLWDYDAAARLTTLEDIKITWLDGRGILNKLTAERAFTPPGGRGWYVSGVRHFRGETTLPFGHEKWERRGPGRFDSAAVEALLKQYRRAVDPSSVALLTRDKDGEPERLSYDSRRAPRAYRFGAYPVGGAAWPVARNVEIIHPEDKGQGRIYIRMLVWVEDRWLVFDGRQFGRINPQTRQLEETVLKDGSALAVDFKPSDIRAGEFKRASVMMTLGELADWGARFSRIRQRCHVQIWRRLAFPFANVILILLTVPLVLRQRSRTALVGIAFAIVMTLAYLATDLIAVDLGNRSVFLWAWAPLAGTFAALVFGGIGAWLFAQVDEV